MKNAIVDILMSPPLLAAAQNYLFVTYFLLSEHPLILFVVVMCFCLVCILLRFLICF